MRLERFLFLLTIATVAFVLGAMWCKGDEPKPLVTHCEHVDCLVVRYQDNGYQHLAFFRANKDTTGYTLLATRWEHETELLWTEKGGKLCLCWFDFHGDCQREVTAESVVYTDQHYQYDYRPWWIGVPCPGLKGE